MAALLVLCGVTGGAMGAWLAGGSTLIDLKVAPDGNEQIEIYTPARWQTPIFHRGIMPAVARLTQLRGDYSSVESGVFESGGGNADIIWQRDFVQIGTVAVYRRSTKHWEINR